MTDATERLADVLGPVRDIHVGGMLEALARALGEGGEVDAEPVERDGEGRVLRSGPLDLPRRRDLRLLEGQRWRVLSAPRARPLGFAPVTVRLGQRRAARIAPFAWSAAGVRLRRGAEAPDWRPLRRWFLEFFQARFGDESPDLLGVVHALRGPSADGDGWRLAVDLGSAPVAAFAAMLDALAATGCADIRVGETADAL